MWIQKLLASKWPAMVWSAFIFVLLCIPGDLLPSENNLRIPHIDKVVHIVLFGVFVVAWALYYRFSQRETSLTLLTLIGVGCLYGILMECVQKLFVPFRAFEGADIVADSAGALLGGMVLYFFSKK